MDGGAQSETVAAAETRLAALLRAGRIAEAECLLAALDPADPGLDRLLPSRAMLDLRAGRAADAVAAAWRALSLAPSNAALRVLLAEALDRAGEAALAREVLDEGVARDPCDARLRLRLVLRDAASDPASDPARDTASAARALPDLLPVLPPEDAPRLLPVLGRLGIDRVGVCHGEPGRVAGWAAVAGGRGDAIRLRWREGGGWRDREIASIDAGAPPRSFAVAWPDGAEDLRVVWASDGAVLEGGARARCLDARRRPSGEVVRSPVVDVIVPVHSGLDETRACLASLFASACETPFEVVLVDDAGPEPALRAQLRELAAEGRAHLLVNPVNRGFTASVNRGLALHPGRDVVLLNADTILPPGWLDRLAAAARSAPDIGTATPLTNNGQIASWPAPYADTPMPAPETLARLDAAAARLNAGRVVDLPTGVGFCLYVRRDCLDAAGAFDDESFGRGYGEETDFCRRAAAQGWRSVCATDVFVGHEGTRSFGAEKARLVARNMPRVRSRHPGFEPDLVAFLRADPLAEPRRRIARATLRPAPRACALALGPADWRDWPGAAILRETAARSGLGLVWLAPDGGEETGRLRLAPDRAEDGPSLVYTLPAEEAALGEDISRLGLGAIHLAGSAGPTLPEGMLASLGLPVTVHVLDPGIAEALGDGVGTVDVRVGSDAMLHRLAARFPGRVGRWAEPAPPAAPPDRPGIAGRIAVVAGAANGPGFAMLLRLARAAAVEGRQLRFEVFGRTPDDAALHATGHARVVGPARDGARAALARALGCRLALALEDGRTPLSALGARAGAACARAAVIAGAGARQVSEPRAPVRTVDSGASDTRILDELEELSR